MVGGRGVGMVGVGQVSGVGDDRARAGGYRGAVVVMGQGAGGCKMKLLPRALCSNTCACISTIKHGQHLSPRLST